MSSNMKNMPEVNPALHPAEEPQQSSMENSSPQAKSSDTEPGLLKGIIQGITTTLAVLIIAVASLAFVVPRFIDAVPLAVLSGSMEPTYSPGDLVISRTVPPQKIAVGDVVTFQPESNNPTLVTHRVIAKSLGPDGIAAFTTQGDANGTTDDPIIPDQIQGKVIYSIPYLGYLTTALDPQMKAVAAAVIGAGLTGYALFLIGSGLKVKAFKRNNTD